MKTLTEIKQALYQQKPTLITQHKVKEIGIFGSYIRSEQSTNSDIDILIETTPEFLKINKGFSAFAKLDEIKSKLKDIFGKHIDIVDKQGLITQNNTYILEKTIYV